MSDDWTWVLINSMKITLSDHVTGYAGDVRAMLAELPAESVHCVVTSPPYWGLRDYGVSDQLGLEPTPEAYVENMVAVFREVRRVLRADGTLWLNLGDSYAASGGDDAKGSSDRAVGRGDRPGERRRAGLKPKDLVGIPWRVAFALQADGWYLRSDTIWAKPNPMPESVTDRPTKAHEYLFLLSKSARYYFDADAVREQDAGTDHARRVLTGPSLEPSGGLTGPHTGIRTKAGRNGSGRNLRSVWTIATEPYPGAHFATFPRKLVEPCVKAGTSERGVCPECGAPWRREVERVPAPQPFRNGGTYVDHEADPNGARENKSARRGLVAGPTTGWSPSCSHTAEPVPAVVLDPFAGSGTVGVVAELLGRNATLIDLREDYLLMFHDRMARARKKMERESRGGKR